MKHNKVILLPIALMILLSSCMKGDFSAHSTVAKRSVRVEGERVVDTLVLEAELSDPEATYTFRLQSPDGDLVWEGGFSKKAEQHFVSPDLSITEGAFFPEGSYTATIYSSEGSDVKVTLTVSSVDENFKNSAECVDDPTVVVVYRDADGNALEGAENATKVELQYKDRYLNDVTVVENL